uniref:Putative polyprotein n=1 Tax=Albugo laibachii Nc14 TaxID=890382 RepID=F0W4L4_9STRA|nr:putative polyprotein [Albugo laibachii Nc14]|eukprot:CCA16048.1 putative polyprotein [Albugo laibachii Nc14]
MDVDDDGPSPNDSDMEVDTSSNPHMARVPQLEIGSKTLLFVYDGQKVKIELCSMLTPAESTPLLEDGCADDQNNSNASHFHLKKKNNKEPSGLVQMMDTKLHYKLSRCLRRIVKQWHVKTDRNGKMLPNGIKVIGHKWVFALKRDGNGQIIRYKARLVAFWLGYYIKHYDVETAFLNGDLEEEGYVKLPEGIEVADELVCKLRRSLYGLKQAAAVWHRTIRAVFISMEFKQCVSDPCMFVREGKQGSILLVLYFDDLLIDCANESESAEIAENIATKFQLKTLGDALFILGMEFGQKEAHPVRNPSIVGQDFHNEEHPLLDGAKPYRDFIGSLLYVANATCPDISTALIILSQHLEQPREIHWNAAIRVLRYLKRTCDTGIKYSKAVGHSIEAYSDASWGNEGPVVYRSKKQSTVALSTAEAEYVALALTTQESRSCRQRVSTLTIKAAISIVSNTGYTPRAKHIDLRVNFIRDHVAKGTIDVKHAQSALQLAESMTKPFPTPQFTKLIGMSGLHDLSEKGHQVEGEC